MVKRATREERCRSSRNHIARRFADGVVQPTQAPGLAAWGQYLDLGISHQHGIYGTSAGVQVLTSHDHEVNRSTINKALHGLPLIASPAADNGLPDPTKLHAYYINKGDLLVTYKVAALVDALDANLPTIATDNPAVVELRKMRRLGGGWADFHKQDLADLEQPNEHATAASLLALSRCPDYSKSQDCREAVKWLCNNIDLDSLSVSATSLCLMALHTCAGDSDQPEQVRAMLQKCRKAVRRWCVRTRPRDVRRSIEATEYLVAHPDSDEPLDNVEHEFTYLLYMPHVMAALAILRTGMVRRGRLAAFVDSVVDVIVDEVGRKGAFVAAGRRLVSSVEQLWVYRLLREYEGYSRRLSWAGRARLRLRLYRSSPVAWSLLPVTLLTSVWVAQRTTPAQALLDLRTFILSLVASVAAVFVLSWLSEK